MGTGHQIFIQIIHSSRIHARKMEISHRTRPRSRLPLRKLPDLGTGEVLWSLRGVEEREEGSESGEPPTLRGCCSVTKLSSPQSA